MSDHADFSSVLLRGEEKLLINKHKEEYPNSHMFDLFCSVEVKWVRHVDNSRKSGRQM